MKPLLYLIPALLLTALVYSLVPQEQQLNFGADSGFLPAGSGADDASVGTISWLSPENITADDASSAVAVTSGSNNNVQSSIRLFVNGSPSGDDKSTGGAWPTGDLTNGGPADTWGLSLTDDDVNASAFGVGYSTSGNSGTSHYLYASDFAFSIPDGATIDGIETVVEASQGAGQSRADFVEMKVYYTEAAATAATGNLRTSSVQIRTGSVNFR